MTTPSNLYAEKIFAEHPLAMWPLDENVDYLSLVDETGREIGSSTPFASQDYVILPIIETSLNLPFPDSYYQKFGPSDPAATLIQSLSFFLNTQIPLTSLNVSDLENLTISFSLKAVHSATVGIEVGYVLYNGVDPSELGEKTLSSAPVAGEWSMYSVTLDLPKQQTAFTHIIPFITVKYNQNASLTSSEAYAYFINGITVGQWSEMYNATSLGVETTLAFSDSNINADAYVTANQYGLGSNDAKYLIADNKLLAQNTSMPMVYGSSNLTRVLPNPVPGSPSLLIPGVGMMDVSGRYNTYTFETWLRVDARSNTNRKILGPVFSYDNEQETSIASTDGLYVDGPFLRLKINDGIGSFFVGEWYRPMLINIRIAINSASMLINGEEVVSFEFNTSSASFSNNAEYPGGVWGVYAYPDVPVVEIDCPAIYSYSVPSLVAKRRFGYGQAVESPDGVNKSFGASTAFIDYSVADYTNNYHYPDMGRWTQGISENVLTDENTLSTPTHELPDFVFQSTNYETWFASQYAANQPYCTFSGNPGFIRFNDISVAGQSPAGLYLIFGISSFSYDEKLLFKIVNKVTGDSFTAKLVFDQIDYIINIRGNEQLIGSTSGVVLNSPILTGASFEQLANDFGGDVLSFFSNASQLLLFVAGDSTYTNMFDGSIYKVGISTDRNLEAINSYFRVDENLEIDGGQYNSAVWLYVLDGGTPESYDTSGAFSHIANYTLVASNNLGIFSIDVDSDSYWQDYLPLSYFSQYVQNSLGDNYYDLDFLQFNIDYPATTKLLQSRYDTRDELVRTYISFQLISGGATKQLAAFDNVEALSKNNVINPDAGRFSGDWLNTAFEVVDGTIIYPPKDISFNDLAIVTHVELKVRGGLNNKLKIRRIQYASQAFNASSANPIGTKFNIPVYPYQKYSSYFDYKSRNPYRIYKGSTPHLFLTKKTGIEKVGDYDPLINRGFLINVNEKAAEEYRVIATQMFLYYSKDTFDKDAVKIFEIQSAYSYIKVYVEPIVSSRKRARIYAIDANTGTELSAIAFYINGKIVHSPVINVNEWTTLGVRFAQPIIFDNYVGAIRFTGPILVNNISYYESSSLQEVERNSVRLWDALAANQNDWEYWLSLINELGQSYKWRDVLVIASTIYSGIDPSDIYKSYTGTNKILTADNSVFGIGKPSYKVINGLAWSTSSVKPL